MTEQTNANDAIAMSYEMMTNAYTTFAELRGSGLPADVMFQIYENLIRDLASLTREVGADFQQYIHTERRRAREARIAAIPAPAVRAPALVVNPPPPADAPRRIRKHNSQVLSRRELDTPVPEPCAICYEVYTRAKSVSTSCGHSFCADCFTTLEHSHTRHGMKCPLCRTVEPRITEYRARKPRAPRNTALPVAEPTTLNDV